MNSSAMARENQNPTQTHDGNTDILEAAMREVFEVMLSVQLDSKLEMNMPRVPDLTALVGISGQFQGILSIRCEKVTACSMVAKMLGSETVEFDDSAQDAVGEICNMVAGSFRSKHAKAEGSVLSVPTIITGTDYQLRLSPDCTRTEICLGFEGNPVWVTLDVHT